MKKAGIKRFRNDLYHIEPGTLLLVLKSIIKGVFDLLE